MGRVRNVLNSERLVNGGRRRGNWNELKKRRDEKGKGGNWGGLGRLGRQTRTRVALSVWPVEKDGGLRRKWRKGRGGKGPRGDAEGKSEGVLLQTSALQRGQRRKQYADGEIKVKGGVTSKKNRGRGQRVTRGRFRLQRV